MPRTHTVFPESREVLTALRRICPGRYFAQAGLFINIASALHVFDITSATDESGHEIKVEYEMTPGFLSCVEFIWFLRDV